MNNKGFMMAEVVVVSAIVLVVLTSLYVSLNKIFTMYNERLNYYDVDTLYELARIRKESIDGVSTNYSTPIVNTTLKKVYYINKNDLVNISTSRITFNDYIDFLHSSLDYDGMEVDNILVMENCRDTNHCKYAYLEVYE